MKIIESHIVPAITEEVRLQEYAVTVFDSLHTRSGLKKAIKKGLLLLNGRKAQTGDWIKEGQKIELLKPDLSGKKIFEYRLHVLFEDDHLAVILKPAGFPTSGNYFRSIENALPYNLSPSKEKDRLDLPLPAHRLDNPTSGILLCAKTSYALIQLQQNFAEKRIQKTYFALVHGAKIKEMEISSAIGGKVSTTLVKPLRTYNINHKTYSLLSLQPLTGRTHQLRIHLSEQGMPIVGDPIYGVTEDEYFKGRNLYLFSGEIAFEHPVRKEPMHFELKLPKKFRNLDYYRVR